LSFVNAAAAADVAPEPPAWHASFARFDNATGTVEPIGEAEGPSSGIQAPAALPSEIGSYVQVAIRAVNPDRVAWLAPVHAYFRRVTTGWTLVGLERTSNTSSAAEMTANGR